MRLLAKIYGFGEDLDAVLTAVVGEYNVRKQEDRSIDFEDIQVLHVEMFHVVLVYTYDGRSDHYIGDTFLGKKEYVGDFTVFPSRAENTILGS